MELQYLSYDIGTSHKVFLGIYKKIDNNLASQQDASEILDALETVQEQDEILENLERELINSNFHPFIKNGIDICQLTKSVFEANSLKSSQLYSIAPKKLLGVLEEIGVEDFIGKSRKKMMDIIMTFVERNCDCCSIWK